DRSRGEVFRSLGGLYQSQGQHQMAFASLQQAIDINGADLLAYMRLGMLYEELVREGGGGRDFSGDVGLAPSK
ncbi:unnamed protein product, partial [Choristocarpus tenellus]